MNTRQLFAVIAPLSLIGAPAGADQQIEQAGIGGTAANLLIVND